MQYYAKNKFYYLLILCILILLLPIILRNYYDNELLIGSDSYTSLRFAQYINENHKLPIDDSFSYGSRPYFMEYGWPVVLSFAPLLLAKWLPILLGIICFILFYNIIQKIDYKITDLASLFFIISPAFIYLFSTASKYSMAITLTLLGFYFHQKNKEILSIISFGVVGFFSYLISLSILAIYLFYTLSNKRFRFFLILFIFNLMTFFLQFKKIFILGMPEIFFGFTKINLFELLNILFSDFGAKYGVSIFLFLLGVVGIYYMWKEKYRYLIVYILLFLSAFLSLYLTFFIYFIIMLISVFAAYAFLELLNHKWRSNTFRFLTILIICCGLLFSTIVYMDSIIKLTPTKNFGEGLNYLRNQDINTTVFSHYTRGIYLTYTGKKNFMDDNFLYASNVMGRHRDMTKLFRSSNINEATAIINKYGIQYIWLDTELREELYGNTEKELLFLLRYSPQSFKKVYFNPGVEIYKYEPVNLTNNILVNNKNV